jgi:glycerol-3-phosphate acyltransferase PlsY
MGLHYLGLALAGYLLGSVPFGLLFGRAFAGRDIRGFGSGHTGALNAWRAAGWLAAALTLVADVGKGACAVWLASRYGWSPFAVLGAGTMVVIGHCWPVWLRFQGGMGLATAGGVTIVTAPMALGIGIASWGIWSLVFRHSPRAIAFTALLMPWVAWVLMYPPPKLALVLALCIVVFVRHVPELTRSYASFWIDRGRVGG